MEIAIIVIQRSVRIFQDIFSEFEFRKCRPNFLEGLELYSYCAELKLGVEYNGIQHYRAFPEEAL